VSVSNVLPAILQVILGLRVRNASSKILFCIYVASNKVWGKIFLSIKPQFPLILDGNSITFL
jgi:hypothetical protein